VPSTAVWLYGTVSLECPLATERRLTAQLCYTFELGPTKRIFRDSNPDLRCVTITLNTCGSIADIVATAVVQSVDRIGRRPLWLTTTTGMLFAYCIITALPATFAKTQNSATGITAWYVGGRARRQGDDVNLVCVLPRVMYGRVSAAGCVDSKRSEMSSGLRGLSSCHGPPPTECFRPQNSRECRRRGVGRVITKAI
jgi:hypothetical protein